MKSDDKSSIFLGPPVFTPSLNNHGSFSCIHSSYDEDLEATRPSANERGGEPHKESVCLEPGGLGHTVFRTN